MKKRSDKELKEIKINMAMFAFTITFYSWVIIQGIMTATTLN